MVLSVLLLWLLYLLWSGVVVETPNRRLARARLGQPAPAGVRGRCYLSCCCCAGCVVVYRGDGWWLLLLLLLFLLSVVVDAASGRLAPARLGAWGSGIGCLLWIVIVVARGCGGCRV